MRSPTSSNCHCPLPNINFQTTAPQIVEGDCDNLQGDQRLFSIATTGELFGGLEFLGIRADFDQNVAMIVDPPVGNRLVPFDYDYELSPRVWFSGQACSGTGFHATYFRFDESANSEAVTAVDAATPVYLFVFGGGGNLSRNANARWANARVESFTVTEFAWPGGDAGRSVATSPDALRPGGRIADMHQTSRGDVFNPGGTLA